jgi:hypothetical protein
MTQPTVDRIFEWNAEWKRFQQRSRSHCRLQIYVSPAQEQVIVIVSSLYSNLGNVGVTTGFPGLKQAIQNEYKSILPSEAKIEWIAHYGMCTTAHSYTDLGTPETYIQLEWNESTGEETEKHFSETEFQNQFNWIDLQMMGNELTLLEKA